MRGGGVGKILPDIRRRQIVNLREKMLQPRVPGLLGRGNEDAEIVSCHLTLAIITIRPIFARQRVQEMSKHWSAGVSE